MGHDTNVFLFIFVDVFAGTTNVCMDRLTTWMQESEFYIEGYSTDLGFCAVHFLGMKERVLQRVRIVLHLKGEAVGTAVGRWIKLQDYVLEIIIGKII